MIATAAGATDEMASPTMATTIAGRLIQLSALM